MLFPDSARNRLYGIGLASAAYLCFATLDASAKLLVRTLPVLEVVWLRFVVHALIMALPMARSGELHLDGVRRPWLQFVRALMLPAMTALNFWALQYLQLAETGAVQFAVPIMIALFAAWLLRERLDAGRWLAIIIGFAGVLVIVRPGTQGFHPAILLALGNAVLYALFNLLTRQLAATDPPAVTNLLSALGAAVLIAPFAVSFWQTPQTLAEWFLILLMGSAGGAGHLWLAQAHRYAPASTIAPFMYQQILYMMLFGWLLFGDFPGAAVLGGAAIVVASGLYLLWRERRDGLAH
ncbi:MAG: DMT family transporter [Burkholderiaceae bacterium]|nr:DMT family transporter [Burkholderiaceae bacterium]